MEEQVVTLFVYKSDRCAKLVKDLYEAIRLSKKRVRIRVVRANIRNPDEFPAFLEYLGELYGSQYVSEYKRYGVEKLPALVVGSAKVFEGYFPSKEELVELLTPSSKPTAEEIEPEARKEEVKVGRSRGCEGCIFYEKASSRCVLLRLSVRDPESPPCGRR